jgi:hypothetical protein
MHMNGWLGIAGILAFALAPYPALLGVARSTRDRFMAGATLPAPLAIYLASATAFRLFLWSLVPAQEKVLGHFNWLLLAFVILIVTGAELKAAGIFEAYRYARRQ